MQLDPPLAWLPYAKFTAHKQEKRIEYWWPSRRYVWVVASDIGRGDPVPAANPETLIDESAELYGAPLRARTVWDKAVRAFEEYGPMSGQELADRLGIKKARAVGMLGTYQGHINRLGHRYCMTDGKLSWVAIYGLPGQTVPWEWDHPVADLLRTRQWYTADDLAKASGFLRSAIEGYVRRHQERIRSVQRKRTFGNREYAVHYYQLRPEFWNE